MFRKSSKFNLRKTCLASVTQRFLFPAPTASARNAWHNDPLLCRKYEEKRFADYYVSETNQNLIKARKFNKLNLEYMTILWELPVSLQAFSRPNVLIIWSWANMNWKQARNSWTGREIQQLNSLPSSPILIALGCIPLSLIHSTR